MSVVRICNGPNDPCHVRSSFIYTCKGECFSHVIVTGESPDVGEPRSLSLNSVLRSSLTLMS